MTRLMTLLTAALIAAGAATVVAQAASAAGTHRPPGVPADFVVTPFGYFHSTCVVHLAKGDELRPDDKIIRHQNGTSSPMTECAYPHYRADGQAVNGDEHAIKDPNISHAWVEYAGVTTTSSYAYLYGEWSVPPTPTSNDGQILYYFNGLEDINDVVTILQPVLGWNSDYQYAWGIASWNCCESGTTYEAPPAPVNSGDTILGYQFANCSAGVKTCNSWDIVTWDLQNGNFSQLLDTSNFGQTFNWAFGGVLEVYNIAQCSDYPSNSSYPGSTSLSFNEIGLFNNKYVQIPNPAWKVSTTSGLSPSCNYGGSLPKQVILNF